MLCIAFFWALLVNFEPKAASTGNCSVGSSSSSYGQLPSSHLKTCALKIMASMRFDGKAEGFWGATVQCSSRMKFKKASAISQEARLLGLFAHFFSLSASKSHLRAFEGSYAIWRSLWTIRRFGASVVSFWSENIFRGPLLQNFVVRLSIFFFLISDLKDCNYYSNFQISNFCRQILIIFFIRIGPF